MPKKWSSTFWADLAERVGTTAIYGLIAVLTGDASGAVSSEPKVWWVMIGLPTALALLKGLAANMASPESGPSLLPSPPAPEVDEAKGEDGAADTVILIAVAALVLAALAIFGVRLG